MITILENKETGRLQFLEFITQNLKNQKIHLGGLSFWPIKSKKLISSNQKMVRN